MAIGDNIKKIRLEKKLKQTDLAKKLDVSQAMVAQYEKGLRKPKIDTLDRIAKALEVPLHELLKSEEMDGSVVIDLTEIQGQDINKYLDALFKKPFSEQPKEPNMPTATEILEGYVHELGEFLYYNPEHKVLFDASMEVKPEDVELAKQMLDRINGKKTD